MLKIKLAIAEDSEHFRKTIIKLINSEKDFEVILEAENGLHLLKQLEFVTPDIILMDIRMPLMDGTEATNRINSLYPNLKIIAFSQHDYEENILKMNSRGVKSFISKGDDIEELFRAIRIVHNGGVYMTDRSAQVIQQYISNRTERIEAPFLNDFQMSLLKAICKGLSSTEIGKIFNKSPRTIEEHRNNLYKKFGVRTKEELITAVYERNLIQNL